MTSGPPPLLPQRKELCWFCPGTVVLPRPQCSPRPWLPEPPPHPTGGHRRFERRAFQWLSLGRQHCSPCILLCGHVCICPTFRNRYYSLTWRESKTLKKCNILLHTCRPRKLKKDCS